MKIYEQADVTSEKVTYSWLLDAPYKMRYGLPGWKWIRGKPGCFVSNDFNFVQATALTYGLTIESNGTHQVHGVPMKEI